MVALGITEIHENTVSQKIVSIWYACLMATQATTTMAEYLKSNYN